MKYRIDMTGIVQGVGCRYYCAQVGRQMHIKGSASNMRDGSVRIIVDVSSKEQAADYARALKQNSFGFRFYGRIDSVKLSEYSGTITGDYTW